VLEEEKMKMKMFTRSTTIWTLRDTLLGVLWDTRHYMDVKTRIGWGSRWDECINEIGAGWIKITMRCMKEAYCYGDKGCT
jgi:hypothetical protein